MTFGVRVLTLFPGLFDSFLKVGLFGRAVQDGLISVNLVNPRDFTDDTHHTVDDRPYGGGDGMVMLAEPLERALSSTTPAEGPVIYLSPQGKPLTDHLAKELSTLGGLTLICGRYGGIDQRFLVENVDEEISIGDYVVNGGEVPAMVLLEAVSRFLPGVLGNSESSEKDSFREGLLEAPLFTRPSVYKGRAVPSVLLSGHHQQIQVWRQQVSILRTLHRRPDLAARIPASERKAAFELYGRLNLEERQILGLPSDLTLL